MHTLMVHPMFIGTTELIIVGAIALLLFGGKKIPGMMRSLGKGMNEFKKGMNDTADPEGTAVPNETAAPNDTADLNDSVAPGNTDTPENPEQMAESHEMNIENEPCKSEDAVRNL